MIVKRLATAALFGLLSIPAFAQTTAPTTATPPTTTRPMAPMATRPATAAPAATAPAATTATAPRATMVNVNTASAAELDKLPSIGKARSKTIVTERAKGTFKDWADFDKRMTGTNVNAGVKAKIKDLITF